MEYRILFVEDEKILGQLVTESLRKEHYNVRHIMNGSNIPEVYREFNPHLCLLDIMLPGKSGYEVAQQIRAIDKNIPIIFLTAKNQSSDLVEGFRVGCNDYIRKPFSIEEVFVRVNSWITEKYGADKTDYITDAHIGDFIFYPDKQELHTPSCIIQLSYKDAAILYQLFIHRNKVVSRNDLLQKVWKDNSIYNSRTLDVYINRLRKHFAGTPNKIITLKGVGYRFICE